MMGGGYFEGGNITPAAEFNIYVDPQAAAEMFAAGIPITMMPLDVTHKAMTTAARTAAIRAIGSRLLLRWRICWNSTNGSTRKNTAATVARYDPHHRLDAAAGNVSGHCNVEIETGSDLTMGMTVIDCGRSQTGHNAFVVGDLDADAFSGSSQTGWQIALTAPAPMVPQ